MCLDKYCSRARNPVAECARCASVVVPLKPFISGSVMADLRARRLTRQTVSDNACVSRSASSMHEPVVFFVIYDLDLVAGNGPAAQCRGQHFISHSMRWPALPARIKPF